MVRIQVDISEQRKQQKESSPRSPTKNKDKAIWYRVYSGKIDASSWIIRTAT